MPDLDAEFEYWSPESLRIADETLAAQAETVRQRCTAETWHDEQKRLVRCDQPTGHEGHHSRMTVLWGIVWPEGHSM